MGLNIKNNSDRILARRIVRAGPNTHNAPIFIYGFVEIGGQELHSASPIPTPILF